MVSQYDLQFQASLDALYAKEIQDLYHNFPLLEPDVFKSQLVQFREKILDYGLVSEPLAISIQKILAHLSSKTRHNLDEEIIKSIKILTLEVYNLVRKCTAAALNDKQLKILRLCFETAFNVAHDGIRYLKSRATFNTGATLLGDILADLHKKGKPELVKEYETRYDQLEHSILDSGVEVDTLQKCLRLLKRRSLSASKDEASLIENQLYELNFNYK